MITVYFMHIALTPHNVREVWHDAIVVPRTGDSVKLNAAYMNQQAEWKVEQVVWLNSRAVTCYMSGPDMRVEWERKQTAAQQILEAVS